MGSQYIRDTTIRTSNKQEIKQDKTRNKKTKRTSRHSFWAFIGIFVLIYGVFISERESFPQVFPHFPQWKRWMDKSGEKWWKMERKQWNSDMSWGI